MNENELKEIWKGDYTEEFPKINFEQVEKNVNAWKNKLRRKIKLEILFIVLFFIIILIPFFPPFLEIIYLLPLIVLVWIWYLWETLRIYRLENDSSKFEETKAYLEKMKSYLVNYIFKSRLISYLGTPVIYLLIFYFQGGVEQLPEKLPVLISVIIFLEILVALIIEIHIAFVYSPTIKKLKDLLKQLEIED